MFLQKLQLGIIIIQKNYFVKKIMQGLFSFYSSYWGSHMDLSWFLTENYGAFNFAIYVTDKNY